MLYVVTINMPYATIRQVVDARSYGQALSAMRVPDNTLYVTVEPIKGDVIRSEEEEEVTMPDGTPLPF